MDKRTVRKASRVLLVAELLVSPPQGKQEAIQLVFSLPGRESTMTRTWAIEGGILTAPQAQDMSVMLEQMMLMACEAGGGIQGVLGSSFPQAD